jgi:LmbE family N-acetylglucosaminyl deacetylase
MTRSVNSISREHSLNGEKLSLLAIFAHPEDESFGPAGTLSKYASEGVSVSLVTATRRHALAEEAEAGDHNRERACSCSASGVRRACLFNHRPGELNQVASSVVVERLVRLIREVRPQVIITFGPNGLVADLDHQIIDAAAKTAFQCAGDSLQFAQHLREGLTAFAPQKFYYCVLPQSAVARWGVDGLNAVPDTQVTTILDVSDYSQAMKNALYCQRHHAVDFARMLGENSQMEWTTEYYALVESRLRRKSRREKDLFAGLR